MGCPSPPSMLGSDWWVASKIAEHGFRLAPIHDTGMVEGPDRGLPSL